jgi:hypothetical protein
MRIEKHELRQRWAQLRSLINEWDPIGLIEAGSPNDEYECIVGPLLRRLEERAGETAIAAFLAAEFDEHFGSPISDSSSFAERAIVWYETDWPGTTAS